MAKWWAQHVGLMGRALGVCTGVEDEEEGVELEEGAEEAGAKEDEEEVCTLLALSCLLCEQLCMGLLFTSHRTERAGGDYRSFEHAVLCQEFDIDEEEDEEDEDEEDEDVKPKKKRAPPKKNGTKTNGKAGGKSAKDAQKEGGKKGAAASGMRSVAVSACLSP